MKKGELTIRSLHSKMGDEIEGLDQSVRLGVMDEEDEKKYPKLTSYDSDRRINEKGRYFYTDKEAAKNQLRKRKSNMIHAKLTKRIPEAVLYWYKDKSNPKYVRDVNKVPYGVKMIKHVAYTNPDGTHDHELYDNNKLVWHLYKINPKISECAKLKMSLGVHEALHKLLNCTYDKNKVIKRITSTDSKKCKNL